MGTKKYFDDPCSNCGSKGDCYHRHHLVERMKGKTPAGEKKPKETVFFKEKRKKR